VNKSADDGADDGFTGEMVLKELKEELGEYLCFVSSDWVVCDVCNKKVRTRDFPYHIENVHYDPPERTWRFGFDQRRKRRVKVYE
jgi:hypothetical protein